MRFFKNGCNGGDGKFLLEVGEKPGIEVFFIMGEMGNFQSLFTLLVEGCRPPYFMKTLLHCQTTLQILSNPPFTFLSSPTLIPTVLSAVLFLWLNGWSHHIWYAILLNDDIDLHMLSLVTLLLEGPWCAFYAIRHQVYWGLKHKVVCYWYFSKLRK